jgi:hypothetical protein
MNSSSWQEEAVCVFTAAVDRDSAYKIGGVQAWWYHRERRAINTNVHKF